MTTTEPTPAPKTQRGWRRGLVIAGIVLIVALALRDRDREAPRAPRVPAAPLATPRALPADASLSAPAQARPRLLVLLPAEAEPPTAALVVRLRQACTDRLAIVEGNERIAREFGIETLPAFVLYGAAGREPKRLTGPGALALLVAELQAMGVPTAGIAAEPAP